MSTKGARIVYVGGALNAKGSKVGVILDAIKGIIVEQSLQCKFKISNNHAEYKAIIPGLTLTLKVRAYTFCIKGNS